MSTATYYVGDVREVLASIPSQSVDFVCTSPPFLAKREYLAADDPNKRYEIGREPTPAAFLDTMLSITAELRRVLSPHGTIAIELGDTYSGSGGPGGDETVPGSLMYERYGGGKRYGTEHTSAAARARSGGWPLPKSLCGIPTVFTYSLAYGVNLLTGERSPAGQWRIRNLIPWAKPNPAPSELGDKFRHATTYITVACLTKDRWFDLEAVRTETNSPPLDWHADMMDGDALWIMPTRAYRGAHYATFPDTLPLRLISAMCPLKVCRRCGKPQERIVHRLRVAEDGSIAYGDYADQRLKADGVLNTRHKPEDVQTRFIDMGWTDCGCDGAHRWRRGVVLDPFAGTGTTLAVAVGCGRDAIGIDLDARNVDLARDRVGMFLDVIDDAETVAF